MAEIVILLMSAVGVYLAWRPERDTVVAEVTYDFQVIHSLAEMKGQPGRPPAYKRPTSSNHLLPFDPIRRQLAVCLIYLKLIDLALHPTHAHRRFNWHRSRNENGVLHDQKVRERAKVGVAEEFAGAADPVNSFLHHTR
jgi:hypothetical protein